jgi:WD40 repeat protein
LLSQAQFSPDGRQVLIACADGQVRRWDTENKLRLPPLLGHTGEVQVATFSRDGRFILSASADETARLWDAVTGQQLFVLAHPNTVYGAQFNAAGDLVVTACGDGIARLWNVATGQMTDALLKCQGAALFDAAFSRDGRHLVIATAGDESMGQVWDLATRQPLGPPLKHDSWVYQARFSPDGRLVVTASFDTTARVWEVGTGRLVRTFKHRLPVKCAQFSPDGRYVLTASWDFVAQLWDVAKGEAVGPPLKHSSYLAHAAFSPDGRRVVTASVRGVTTLWDLAPNNWQAAAASSVLNRFGPEFTGGSASARETSAPPTSAESLPLNGASEALFQVKPNRAGDRLLVLSSRSPSTGTVQTVGQLWDALNWRSLASAFACSERMTNALLSENGQRLLEIVGQEVEVWDTVKGRALFSLPHTNPVSGGAFDVAARRILTWCGRDAQIWDASAGQARLHFPHVRSVKHAAFSPDGQQVVTTSGTNAHLWNALTGQPVHSLAHVTDVSHAAFSPDGRRLVTCCKDGTPAECAAYIWDVSTGRRIGEPLRHRDGVNFAIFSLDGQRLLTTSEDSTAQVWDAATGRPLTQPLVHGKTLNQACFSANGRWVATGSWDQTARIWDAETGEPLSPPLRHPWYVHFLQFTADGQRLVARRLLGDSRIWDLPRHPHAVEDLVLLSQLLSGHQIDTDGGALPLTRDALENIWRTLRARQPADVSVTSAETLAWHEHELERSEKARQWFAARFHLDWLLARQPNDALLLQRRARAEAQLGRPGAS